MANNFSHILQQVSCMQKALEEESEKRELLEHRFFERLRMLDWSRRDGPNQQLEGVQVEGGQVEGTHCMKAMLIALGHRLDDIIDKLSKEVAVRDAVCASMRASIVELDSNLRIEIGQMPGTCGEMIQDTLEIQSNSFMSLLETLEKKLRGDIGQLSDEHEAHCAAMHELFRQHACNVSRCETKLETIGAQLGVDLPSRDAVLDQQSSIVNSQHLVSKRSVEESNRQLHGELLEERQVNEAAISRLETQVVQLGKAYEVVSAAVQAEAVAREEQQRLAERSRLALEAVTARMADELRASISKLESGIQDFSQRLDQQGRDRVAEWSSPAIQETLQQMVTGLEHSVRTVRDAVNDYRADTTGKLEKERCLREEYCGALKSSLQGLDAKLGREIARREAGQMAMMDILVENRDKVNQVHVFLQGHLQQASPQQDRTLAEPAGNNQLYNGQEVVNEDIGYLNFLQSAPIGTSLASIGEGEEDALDHLAVLRDCPEGPGRPA